MKLMLFGLLLLLSLGTTMAQAITGFCYSSADCSGSTTTPLANAVILLKLDSGTLVSSTLCNTDGEYQFTGIPAGDYKVERIDPPGFNNAPGTLNPVAVKLGSSISGLTFVSTSFPLTKGTAYKDVDCNNSGDIPNVGCTIEICDLASPFTCVTKLTDTLGEYEICLDPGMYSITQLDCLGGQDSDGGDVDSGIVTVPSGATATVSGIDFTDWMRPHGTVMADVNCDTVLTPVENCVIELCDTTSSTCMTTLTTASGEYEFCPGVDGTYTIEQISCPGYDSTGGTDTDLGDPDVGNNVVISGGTTMPLGGHDFVDTQSGCPPTATPSGAPSVPVPCVDIKGFVFEDTTCDLIGNVPRAGCEIQCCEFPSGANCATVFTNTLGEYEFPCVAPGSYSISQISCPGFDFRGGSDTDGGKPDTGVVTVPLGSSTAAVFNFIDWDSPPWARVPGIATWWCDVSNNFCGPPILRECKMRNDVPPSNGSPGSTGQPKTCFFGTDFTCPFGPAPTTRCVCAGNGATWDCTPVTCPTQPTPTHCYI